MTVIIKALGLACSFPISKKNQCWRLPGTIQFTQLAVQLSSPGETLIESKGRESNTQARLPDSLEPCMGLLIQHTSLLWAKTHPFNDLCRGEQCKNSCTYVCAYLYESLAHCSVWKLATFIAQIMHNHDQWNFRKIRVIKSKARAIEAKCAYSCELGVVIQCSREVIPRDLQQYHRMWKIHWIKFYTCDRHNNCIND